jgi:mono/diheme cytochrome c family protein
MRRSAGFLAFATLAATAVAACGPAAVPQEEAQGPTRADSVGMALQAFDASVFDTIAWESDQARSERGGLVFTISCSKCHGPHGGGDGNFVIQGDTLRPPSFLQPEWGFADAPMALRRYIFSGNVAGMPYWGLVGLKYRDIDAVAYFIETPLRAGIPTP